MGQTHKKRLAEKKTKKVTRQSGQAERRQTKRNKRSHYGGYAATFTSAKDDVCSKNINNLLIGEFKTNPNMLGSDPKNFANDIKKEANSVKNVASGNWLSLPGPPPKFPTCSVM